MDSQLVTYSADFTEKFLTCLTELLISFFRGRGEEDLKTEKL